MQNQNNFLKLLYKTIFFNDLKLKEQRKKN